MNNLNEIKILGSGSYGSVKLFYDQESNQQVVGKLLVATGDQQHIENELANAEREAKLLARLSHENIIKVLGFVHWDDHSVMTIMEYAPCKDLEHLLMTDKDIDLPWKLRARFFTELANALDYLHNHDPKKAYIHGDLKPQNVLLGDALTIKLTGITINSGGINNQHAQLYAPPEYSVNPVLEKKCNMDVYSYAMVGYEILTRQVIYSEGNASQNVVPRFGIKNCLDDVANDIKNNNGDLAIFNKLKEVYKQCLKTDPQHRPNMCDVKKDLYQLARTEKIYDDETDQAVKLLIEKRKLNPTEKGCDEKANPFKDTKSLESKDPETDDETNFPTMSTNFNNEKNCAGLAHPKKTSNLETDDKAKLFKLSKSAVIKTTSVLLAIGVACCAVYLQIPSVNVTTGFLVADDHRLKKYDINTKTITNLLYYPSCFLKSNTPKQVLMKENIAYIITGTLFLERTSLSIKRSNTPNTPVPILVYAIKANLSNPTSSWNEINWKEEHKFKKFIVFDQSIFAVGGAFRVFDDNLKGTQHFYITSSFDRYDIATRTWTKLPNMNEQRYKHTLVVFQQSICAIGGDSAHTLECFKQTSNEWIYLPSMNVHRNYAAAVELKGELYVMGGFYVDHLQRKLTTVEKFNPVSGLWAQVADLNEKRADFTAGVFNGKIYVIGGGSSVIEAYDPSTNVWQQIDNKPEIGFNAKFTAF